MHRHFVAVATAAVLSFAGAAAGIAGLGPEAHAQQRGGTLVFTIPASDYASMDGHQEASFATVHVTAPHYSLLIRLDPADPKAERLEGDLAQGWSVSKDGKTYTFPLKPGATFHDGSRVTAEDVVASFQHIIFPPPGVTSTRRSYYSMVESIAADGDARVVFKLKFASSAFLAALAVPFNYIYPAAKLKEDPHWFKTHVLGSGPFVYKSDQRGANWIGVRNEHYFKKGLPYLDGFEGIYTAKENIEIQAIRGGRSMIQFRGFPPAARDDLKAAMGDEIVSQESIWNCGLYVIPNSFKKPFDDIRVRRALNLAIDRWGGSRFLSRIATTKAVGGFVIPGHPLAMSEEELSRLPGYGKDAAKAKDEARRLLKEAGVPEGFSFKMINRNTDQPYKLVGTYVVDQWRQVGLNAEQTVMPSSVWIEAMQKDPPPYEVAMGTNCQSIVNPAVDLQRFISKDRTDGNEGHYIDRTLDRLYDAQLREPDFAKQKKLVNEFDRYLIESGLHITTLWWNRITLQSAKVHGWYISPSHFLNQQLEGVWLQQ